MQPEQCSVSMPPVATATGASDAASCSFEVYGVHAWANVPCAAFAAACNACKCTPCTCAGRADPNAIPQKYAPPTGCINTHGDLPTPRRSQAPVSSHLPKPLMDGAVAQRPLFVVPETLSSHASRILTVALASAHAGEDCFAAENRDLREALQTNLPVERIDRDFRTGSCVCCRSSFDIYRVREPERYMWHYTPHCGVEQPSPTRSTGRYFWVVP